MKKLIIVSIVCIFSLMSSIASFAQDKRGIKQSKGPMPRSNFTMIYGSISKIDSSDPNNIKLEITNQSDNETHTINVVPTTNITKATDVSELKTGEKVRVMARKVGDDKVALGVMFGKIRKPAKRPIAHSGKMISETDE